MPAKDKYTDPELREQVKKDVQESDKGGAPGQWSARKVSHDSSSLQSLNALFIAIPGPVHGFRVQETRRFV